jgi:hypothetical protein
MVFAKAFKWNRTTPVNIVRNTTAMLLDERLYRSSKVTPRRGKCAVAGETLP